MNISPEAKEQIDKVLSANPEQVFRISLQGGGCAGFRYQFDLDEQQDDDIIIEEGIVIDPISNRFLETATLKFKDDPFLKMFFLESPEITSTCGCGESVGF